MPRVMQIAVLAKIAGNVNADEVIGQRITLKKFYTSEGEVKPFISARAIKYSIRQALRERGFDIDPFKPVQRRLIDSGDPVKYVDNDIFGFLVATEREQLAERRQAPIALSYLRALRDTAVKAEFALRAPRPEGVKGNPLPFEVEVAEWVGKIDCLIYDYIGIWQGTEGGGHAGDEFISTDERKNRLKTFLEIFLTPTYVLPRRTNSLMVPRYIASLITLSEKGPWPIYQYLDYIYEADRLEVDVNLINNLKDRGFNLSKLWIVDYSNAVPSDVPNRIEAKELARIISEAVDFTIRKP